MSTSSELQQTIADMVDDHRGILAADESLPTITKRFAGINVEATEENRRAYRALLLDTPDLGKYIAGVILFEETLAQKDDNQVPLPEVAWSQKIVPGVKVDKGKGPLPGAPGDLITYGLDGLANRLEGYKKQGARFAKWREVYPISHHNPTQMGRHANAEMLARYAAVCQEMGVVPIVEPEVLMDGDHDIDRCASVTEHVLHSVFHALHLHGVSLEHMILKPNMVAARQGLPHRRSPGSGRSHPAHPEACGTCRRAQHQFSVWRPGTGRSHRQPECHQSAQGKCAVATEHLLWPGATAARPSCLAGQAGKQGESTESTAQARTPQQPCQAR